MSYCRVAHGRAEIVESGVGAIATERERGIVARPKNSFVI